MMMQNSRIRYANFQYCFVGKTSLEDYCDPDSLCSPVLRTRYLHNQELMGASAPRTTSKIWRAILAGRDALKLGLIKRVGSGHSISIWNDSWIPKSASMRPMGCLQDTDMSMISELLTENHEWNVPLVRSIFFALDADSILSIPLRVTHGDDWLAWSKENSGIYSIRSAYRALMEKKQHEEVANGLSFPSSSDNESKIWKCLWKLPVVLIPKVRVFWWRVLRGILQDYETLSQRHIMENNTCGLARLRLKLLCMLLLYSCEDVLGSGKRITFGEVAQIRPINLRHGYFVCI
jgi:hypothetical protein